MARLTRSGTSCSATTACGPASCGVGTPDTASRSTGRRRTGSPERAGYARSGRAVTVTRAHLESRVPTRRIRRAADGRHGRSTGPAELLRSARMGDGLPHQRRSTRSGTAAARRRGHRCGRRVDAAAVQPLRRVPLLHHARRAAQRRYVESGHAGRRRTTGMRARQHGPLQVVLQTWCAGVLGVADALPDLAADARVLDMRASPYDLTAYGIEPIAIEDAAGRTRYVRHQRDIADRAAPLRTALLQQCRRLLAAVRSPAITHG